MIDCIGLDFVLPILLNFSLRVVRPVLQDLVYLVFGMGYLEASTVRTQSLRVTGFCMAFLIRTRGLERCSKMNSTSFVVVWVVSAPPHLVLVRVCKLGGA